MADNELEAQSCERGCTVPAFYGRHQQPHATRCASVLIKLRRLKFAPAWKAETHVKKPGSATDPLWYKDAIIYELHVRAFQDSNSDGIGDFPGLISRLDYLQDLGVTCLWLLPFFPSPLRDDGYDIADYTGVHPSYGTIDDFK